MRIFIRNFFRGIAFFAMLIALSAMADIRSTLPKLDPRNLAITGSAIADQKLLESRGSGRSEDWVQRYVRAAESGEANAACLLGLSYDLGVGVEQDYAVAARWYEKAATQGNSLAQYHLAILYYKGRGVAKDLSMAFSWFKRSAEQGEIEAQFNLAVFYATGKGVSSNFTEALKWYQKAADQDYGSAEYNLGNIYYYGSGGIATNEAMAWSLWEKSAKQGVPPAQFKIGRRYLESNSDSNIIQGIELTRAAAKAGYADAQDALGIFYSNGLHRLPRDDSEALRWFLLAAQSDQGQLQAQYNAGVFYQKGRGVPTNQVEAFAGTAKPPMEAIRQRNIRWETIIRRV